MYDSVYVAVYACEDFIADGISQFGQGVCSAWRIVDVIDNGYHLTERDIGDIGNI